MSICFRISWISYDSFSTNHIFLMIYFINQVYLSVKIGLPAFWGEFTIVYRVPHEEFTSGQVVLGDLCLAYLRWGQQSHWQCHLAWPPRWREYLVADFGILIPISSGYSRLCDVYFHVFFSAYNRWHHINHIYTHLCDLFFCWRWHFISYNIDITRMHMCF